MWKTFSKGAPGNKDMFRLNGLYSITAITLLVIELCIGKYLHDPWVRPYGGDLLVVILIYCTIKSFVDTPVIATTCGVLLFSCAIEITQYFHLTRHLGWENSALARIALGSSFSLVDILLYTIGCAVIIIVENIRPAGNRVLKI